MTYRRPSELPPALAVLAALVLHGSLLAILARSAAPQRPTTHPPAPYTTEVELESPPPDPSTATTPAAAELPGAAPASSSVTRPRGVAAEQPEATAELDSIVPAPATPEPMSPEAPRAARRAIDLGLDGSLRTDLLLGAAREREDHRQPSIGLLQEGLDARDAERGVSRSSAAVQAAYRASSVAPPRGIAVFEVEADAGGNVVAVRLLGFGSDESRWQRVAGSLRDQLKRRRLRVPAGAAGLVTRIRIERGDLAKDVADLHRTERGVALGQDYLGPKDRRDESTRASQEPGKISPTLGGAIGGGKQQATRVVVLSERRL